MADELLSLKWNNHKSTFADILSVLRDQVSSPVFLSNYNYFSTIYLP